MALTNKPQLLLCLSLGVWLLVVGAGLGAISKYEGTAGASATAPAVWPSNSRIQTEPGKPTLVMLVHPHCPCSRASIGELAILMAQAERRVNARVLFVKPPDFADDWEKTDLWASAAAIPGVTVSVDEEGAEARRFGSHTSGQVVLYGADGSLLFSGGITSARGHAGDNAGRSALAALLAGDQTGVNQTPVFGCPIFRDRADEQHTDEQQKDSCHVTHRN